MLFKMVLLRRTYNPEDRRSKQPKSKEEAMSELVAAIENLKPDNFTPTIIDKQVVLNLIRASSSHLILVVRCMSG